MRVAVLLFSTVLALAGTSAATPPAVAAPDMRIQVDSCAPPTHGLVRQQVMRIKAIVAATSGPDASLRSTYSLPAMPPDSVMLITDPALCLHAANRYTRGLRGDSAALALPIMVVRVGPNRFVVADHQIELSQSHFPFVRVVFDSTWTPIVIVRS